MGGIIRDVICNDIPLIFRSELYATACLLGALAYIIMSQFSELNSINAFIGVAVVVIARLLAIKFKWQLPVLKL